MEASTMQTSVQIGRQQVVKEHSFDDILYLIMGDASVGSAVLLILTMVFFGSAPVLLLLLFANYSGGMRWLLTLAIVTVLGILAIYLMKRGTLKKHVHGERKEVQMEFSGQLTEVTAAVERGEAGYVYSQQMLRERLCDNIINKLSLARDLSSDEIITKLENNDTEFIGDDTLARFLQNHRRGIEGSEQTPSGKGKSVERGRKFMMEIEVILDKIEEIV